MTAEAYLELDGAAAFRSEYLNGEMFAKPGGSVTHSQLIVGVGGALEDALEDGPCLVKLVDMRLEVMANRAESTMVTGSGQRLTRRLYDNKNREVIEGSKHMPVRNGNIDFIAYDRDGHVLLLAEAKSRHGTSASWAAGLRRNMLSHGLLPASKYFLIATPERLYLWRHEQPDGAEVPPQVTVDAENVLEPYFQKLHQEPSKIGPEAFEHLVLAWLKDIAKPDRATPDGYPSQEDASSQWLAELSRSLKEADIELNPRS